MAKKKKRSADEYKKPGTELAGGPSGRARAGQAAQAAAGSAVGAVSGAATKGSSAASDVTSSVKTKGKNVPTPKANAKAKAKRAKAAPAKKQGMTGTQQWLLLAGLFGLLLVGAIIWSVLRQTGGSGVTTTTGWDLPARSADTQDGESDRIRLADYAGTPTVINFFSSDCEFCDADIVSMINSNASYGDQADFILINTDDTSGEWRDVLERNGAIGVLPVAHDIGGNNRNGLFRALGGSPDSLDNGRTDPIPATAFYDSSGRLESVTFAPVRGITMLQQLAALGVETT